MALRALACSTTIDLRSREEYRLFDRNVFRKQSKRPRRLAVARSLQWHTKQILTPALRHTPKHIA
jgi:hypothetical protein